MASVVGIFIFTHHWFWFPLAHFLSLAFTPTCLIGLNADLKVSSVTQDILINGEVYVDIQEALGEMITFLIQLYVKHCNTCPSKNPN